MGGWVGGWVGWMGGWEDLPLDAGHRHHIRKAEVPFRHRGVAGNLARHVVEFSALEPVL